MSRAEMTLDELLSFSYFEKSWASPTHYGYGGTINDMRKREFSRIGDMTYLDHVGATLFPKSLLENYMADLSENVYGNPHSQNIRSRLTHDTIEHVRYRILEHFNTTAEEYTVIFTSGTTAALKLVAETFPWTSANPDGTGSLFCYLTDNHTSVVGMREVTKLLKVPAIPVTPEDVLLSEKQTSETEIKNQSVSHLFCYPALSNSSGTKYPLFWIEKIKSGKMTLQKVPGNWSVLLDAASYVSTSPLDLTMHQPDFITISFYKIFGFPTGLGALLVSNHIAPRLQKRYFGGGTAAAYLSGEDFYVPKSSIADRFEDGTVSFLEIIALKHGFDTLERLTGGMKNIRNHTHALASYTCSVLSALRYANGQRVIHIYSDTEVRTWDVQGPIINFNVLDENGSIIGYTQVDKMASLYNIHFRTGCFCNSGACQKHLRISNLGVKKNLQAGHVCGDDMDLIDGRPTGSIRISFGFMSTFEDAKVFLKFIVDSFIKQPSQSAVKLVVEPLLNRSGPPKLHNNKQQTGSLSYGIIADNTRQPGPQPFTDVLITGRNCLCKTREAASLQRNVKPITLTHIYLYPIKSCAAFQVSQWPIAEQGLLFDRHWMIVNENGVCLSQKQEPSLCLIQPSIDLNRSIMIIEAEGMAAIEIPLNDDSSKVTAHACQNKVCGDRVNTYDCGEQIANWLCCFLNRKCRLIRQSSSFIRYAHTKTKDASLASLSLVNEAQYLLVNTASIFHLSQLMVLRGEIENMNVKGLIQRFRANLVIDGNIPFEEEAWSEVFIGCLHFKLLGKCTRCQIICIDQQTGEKKRELLQTLSFCKDGKTTFGMYLQNSSCSSYPTMLAVGSLVLPTLKDFTEEL
ncbi:molybdenum cofactor sulfurase [Spea bombifrons]|uniref:molybdenum cofactor sulfurase n=1 Tax=Spea bombifrons TaxID=233779 RepID=UPI0023499411|nr:molybdenum cofactor sulfurase [Spea bombifrons]